MQHREIFTAKYLREVGKHFDLQRDLPQIAAIRQHVADWQESFYNGTIIKQSEIQLQKEFLSTFFAGCLGYHTKIGRSNWELDYEQTTEVDATRADGYLGFFTPNGQKTIAVIELKDANTDLDRPQNRKNDKRTPVEQAFSYVPKVGQDCRWVVVSNFKEIRLYHAQDQGRYEYFHITKLHEDEQLWRFLFLLHRDRLLPHGSESYLEHYHRQRLEQEQTISLDFYKKFKDYRQRLFQHLKVQNPEQPELLLFEKTQKLLDRIIFVLFCEDKGLLPVDMIRKVRQAAHASLDPSEGQGFWAQLKALFRSIDKGNPSQNINRYNGGLFAHDPALDELRLDDSMIKVLLELSNYDFDSDLNVNILGHIFEQSISDIEEIKADIQRAERVAHLEGVPPVPVPAPKESKRKKDGIFYTPEYITRYIVREAVGGWLDDRKRALGFETLPELSSTDLASVKTTKGRPVGNAAVEKHRTAWTAYREELADIKVLDPACGSGAFLIQVFDYLSAEGERVNDELARLSFGLRSTDDLSRNILSNNIFGVDINAESVEISKLALWLKTANIHSELNSLDQNIRCGNSLIDDPAVAGDLAFDWKAEFAEIFERKGGFDVVVGNPPYVPASSISQKEKDYYYKRYYSTEYQLNTYGLFVEMGIGLLKNEAWYSLIIPNYWLSTKYDQRLREIVFTKNFAVEVLNTFQIFIDATVDTLILTGRKTTEPHFPKSTSLKSISSKLDSCEARLQAINNLDFVVERLETFDAPENIPHISFEDGMSLKGEGKLLDYFDFFFGMKPYQEGKGKPKQTREIMNNKVFHSTTKLDETFFPLLTATSVKRYRIAWEGNFIKYGIHLAEPRKIAIFENQRILMNRILSNKRIDAVLLETTYINNSDVFNLIPKQDATDSQKTKALFAIIVSSLCAYYFKRKNVNLTRDAYPKLNLNTLESFPIPEISPEKEANLAAAADQMLALQRELHTHKKRFLTLVQSEFNIPKLSRNLENWESLDFKAFAAELAKQKVVLTLSQKSEWLTHFEQERAIALGLQEQIRSTDQRIDEMVFDLYGLTAEERALVLGA